MSLDKAIASGKEKRKPYRKSKAFDRTCRCHGSCGWCQGNRKHATRKREQAANDGRTHYVGDGCCDFCGGHGQNCAKCDNRGRGE